VAEVVDMTSMIASKVDEFRVVERFVDFLVKVSRFSAEAKRGWR